MEQLSRVVTSSRRNAVTPIMETGADARPHVELERRNVSDVSHVAGQSAEIERTRDHVKLLRVLLIVNGEDGDHGALVRRHVGLVFNSGHVTC